MASVRIAICVTDEPVTVKDPLWVWTAEGKAVLLPSVGFESSNVGELTGRVIREVLATFKAFNQKNRKIEQETVKILDS